MLKKIIYRDILLERSKTLSRKKFRAGFDGMSMDGAHAWIYINGERLCRDIYNGDYRPMPAVGFHTAKMNGGFRKLARLSAIDTVLQTVLNDALSPIAEKRFSDNSFAYRSGRGVHSALERYVALADNYRLAAKLDFNSCFENINHTVLQKSIGDFFGNKKLCDLIMAFAKMPISVDGEINETEKGLIQGMPIAPLLCNIYLHSADEFLEADGVPFIRYADDLVIFGESAQEIKKRFDTTVSFFEKELGLMCNRKKSRIDASVNLTFLGYKFSSEKNGILAYEANSDTKRTYHNWHSHRQLNSRGKIDLISDGILRQKDFSLLFDTDTVDTAIPIVNTDSINIYSNVVLDSGFLNLTMKNGITVNVFDRSGDCVGSFVPNKPLKSPKVTHEQLMAYYDERRLELAREFVLASIHNTLLNIRYYNKQNNDALLEQAINALGALKARVKTANSYEKLLLLEAQCRKAYYGCFDTFIKRDGFVFETRTKRPPENEVNAMISFGNSVLYSLISREIQKTALDVRVGYLHATNTRYASLNLDIAEIFKPLIVDRVVFALINKSEIQPNHFTRCENDAVYLTQDGKRVFLRAFYEKLDTVLTNKEEKMSYNTIIIEEIRKLIRLFRDNVTYKAFRQVR